MVQTAMPQIDVQVDETRKLLVPTLQMALAKRNAHTFSTSRNDTLGVAVHRMLKATSHLDELIRLVHLFSPSELFFDIDIITHLLENVHILQASFLA